MCRLSCVQSKSCALGLSGDVYFPPRSDLDQFPFYYESMLMSLKPWRQMETDLKKATQSWDATFKEFLKKAPEKTTVILSGIQGYQQCQWSAMRQVEESAGGGSHTLTLMVELEATGDDARPLQSQRVLAKGPQGLQASEELTIEGLHAYMAVETLG